MNAIVVAEDELIRAMIRDAPAECRDWLARTVDDGRALLKTLASMVPALVVLDVNPPHVDGSTAYHRLRELEHTREVPVLFLTAAPHLVWRARLKGRFEVLDKPFDLDILEQRVSHLIQGTDHYSGANVSTDWGI